MHLDSLAPVSDLDPMNLTLPNTWEAWAWCQSPGPCVYWADMPWDLPPCQSLCWRWDTGVTKPHSLSPERATLLGGLRQLAQWLQQRSGEGSSERCIRRGQSIWEHVTWGWIDVEWGLANSWGSHGNSDRIYFGGTPKSLQMVTAAMKLKDTCSLEETLWPT